MIDDILSPGEKVLRTIRRHPISLFPVVLAMGIVVVVVLVGFYAIGRYADIINPILSVNLVSLFLLAVLLLLAVITLLSVYVFHQSRLVLTNENLFQIKQIGIFDRKVSAVNLRHIEDVTSRVHGLFATVLGYGEISVETAGEQENFIFSPVANPHPLVELINQTHQDYEQQLAKGGSHR